MIALLQLGSGAIPRRAISRASCRGSASKRYDQILVREFHEPDFWYDYSTWPKPSGIRQALLDNYGETGHIRAAKDSVAHDPYLFSEITVLEPKAVR